MKSLPIYLLVSLCSILVVSCSSQEPYIVVEQMPSYPGGEDEMNRYIMNNLHIPNLGDDPLNFSTSIRFIVTKTGKIKDIRAAKSRYEGMVLTDSMVAIIKRMPDWIPGKQKDKPVDVYFTLPIHINPR